MDRKIQNLFNSIFKEYPPDLLMSPTVRPGSRTYFSRRSMSPVPLHLSGGGNMDNFPNSLGSPGLPHSTVHQQAHNEKLQNNIAQPVQASTLVSLPFTSPAVTQSTTEVLKKLVGRHVLNAGMFGKNELHSLFNLAQFFRMSVHKDRAIDNILRVR